ncbi:hypothetical protein BJX76DRAFT_364605 [Aspergillus varians]
MATQDTVVENHPDDLREFYEVVCLTRSLSAVRGDRIKPASSAESDEIEVAKCRRNFADAIAYFCAYDGDPDNVTAVALGRTNTKVVVWVASNTNVSAKVINFLNDPVLNIVQRLACATTERQLPSGKQELVCGLLDDILKFAWKKIYKYYKNALGTWTKICKALNPQDKTNPDISAFYGWFKTNFYKSGNVLGEHDMPGLAMGCYVARTEKAFEILRYGSSQGNEQRLDYERLYKLLGKVGKHIGLFKRMMEATTALRYDFREGFQVKSITASTSKRIPLPKINDNSVKKIVARIFQTEDETNQFNDHLDRFYNRAKIYQALQQCQEKGRTRVHAEILLIDYFDKSDVTFLDNDNKYIGCSKPACYLCYQYICQHPGNYIPPPSHQKLYHAWSLPTIRANDLNCMDKLSRHEQFLNKVTEILRSDLRNEVQRQVGPRESHADSTAGASSVANTGRARPTLKTSDHAIHALIRLLSKADINAKCDADHEDEDGGVKLHC